MSALAIAGFLAVGSLAWAQPPFCAGSCTCQSSCSQACNFIIIIGGEPVVVASTCGAHGVCTTSQSCNPQGCEACTHTINGTSGNDTINGTANKECIYGFSGNDTIDGNAGDDRIYAGDGTDTAYGDSGNDCLFGDAGNDYLDGESGTDLANGGAGTDTCIAENKVSCP